MIRFTAVSVICLCMGAFFFSACSKKGPEKKMVTLPSGEKIEMTSVNNNPAFEQAMTKTIEGKIELVSLHPSPAALPPEIRKGVMIASIVTTDGERVFPFDKDGKLRKNAGKKIIMVGMLMRNPVHYQGKLYKMYDIKELKSLQ